ncbi:MAG TPA: hypothetical protein VLJ44_01765 [Gaiellaceae bacterium]|nr:hypothetical protein [Gaiellaceae bacterium]
MKGNQSRRVIRLALAALICCGVVTFGASNALTDSGPSSDWAVTLSGPNQSAYGAVDTYTMTITNKGPDPSGYQWQLNFRWNGETMGATLVGYDCPGVNDSGYTPPGYGNQIASVTCGSPSPPIPVGASQTMHVSLKWSDQGVATVGGGDTTPNYVPDPDRSNNQASIDVVVTPSGSQPGGGGDGGGGGSGGGTGGTPTATFKFVDQIPGAQQYRPYYADLNSCDYPPATCKDSAETTLLSGTVPPGLKLGPGGQIYGTPTTPGTYTLTVEAAQDFGSQGIAKVSHDYTIVVDPYRSTSGGGSSTPTLTLPNQTRTPGVTNAAVTQRTINKTICVSGWTTKVRPTVSFTDSLKLKQMKQYGEKGKPTAYEEDHLIPLELGGAPRNPKNLGPEPRSEPKHSDPLETQLKRKVCAGALPLAAARQQILTFKRKHG